MRRRLVSVVVGLTALIVVGFAVPLAIVVREIQRDDGVDAAVATASSIAAFVDNDTPVAEIRTLIDRLGVENPEYEVTVYARDGRDLGADRQRDEIVDLAFEGRETTVREDGGLVDYAPNNGPFAGPSDFVIRVEAPAAAIEPDLSSFYLVLGLSALLAVGLAALSGVLAARSIAAPTRRLTETARRLQRGDLDAEIAEEGPEEIRELARTLALLSARVRELLHAERESAADLAHRLRTPLTALHLELEALPRGEDRDRLLARATRLERELGEVIAELRREAAAVPELADIREVVRERVADWAEPVADRGHRLQAKAGPAGVRLVAVSRADLEAAIDALIDNALTHTPAGTEIRVALADDDSDRVFTVSDDGPGFPSAEVGERGVSRAESSGLGLDIARRTAERAGGGARLGASESGGALVELRLPSPPGGSTEAS